MRYHFEKWADPQGAHKLVVDFVHMGTQVLELGSATGYMTRYMSEKLNCTVTAVELDSKMAEVARPYCKRMIVANLEEDIWYEKLQGYKFDHIVCADVLEHLRNPSKVLSQLKNLLKEDGTIIISIPNIAYSGVLLELFKGEFNYRPAGILDETHIYFFTRQSFLTMISDNGFFLHNLKASSCFPDQSEFGLKYEDYSYRIQKAVFSRRDAHVYQYIAVIGKKEICGVSIPLDFCATEKKYSLLAYYWLARFLPQIKYIYERKIIRFVKRIQKSISKRV